MKKLIYLLLIFVPASFCQAQNYVTQVEYFIDTDTGIGLTPTIMNITAPDTVITQTITIPIPPNTSLGYHKLYFRTRDTNGNWSHTVRKNVQVIEDDDSLYVVEVEYFFVDSTDLGFTNCSAVSLVPPATEGTWTFNVPYPTGPYNFNDTLFVRVRDSLNEKWSHTTMLDACCTGINEFEKLIFNISPNPAADFVNIELPYASLPVLFTLHSLIGEKLLVQVLTNRKTSIGFNYPDGIYLITLRDSSKIAAQKIIIQQF